MQSNRPSSKLPAALLSALSLALTGGPAANTVLADNSAIVVVPGQADPWLAGMPDGSLDPSPGGVVGPDSAPAQSPSLVTGISIAGGLAYSFTASGTVDHGPGFGFVGPDGDPNDPYGIPYHAAGVVNGIGNMFCPFDALVGVFLGPQQPNLTAAPAGLDFSSSQSRDYLTLSPQLQQPFFIGDGFTSSGIAQEIIAPAGATRLFLGVMDGYQWANNEGQFIVTASAPEPFSSAILGCGALALIITRRRIRTS
jgi:hypothetical protein